MIGLNLLGALMALTLPGAQVPPDQPGEIVEPTVCELSEVDRAYLIRIARRTLRHAVLGRNRYEPDYVPASLASLSAEVVVRLRQRGYLLAVGTAGPKPIALAARDASFAAAQQLTGAAAADLDLLSRLLVELEVISPAEPIPAGTNWTEPRAVDAFIEPGVHGMVLTGPRGRQRFCPSDLITSDLVLAAALDRLAKRTHGSASQLGQVQLERFRTLHFYQGISGDKIVSLHRGMTLVPPEAVSPAGLDAAIEKLARYMLYRQKKSGLFTYQYEPATDVYSDEDNLVRQVGATLAMAVHARRSGATASLAAAAVAVRYHLQGLTPIPGLDDAAFIRSADGRNKLGVTALLCCSLAHHPAHEQYAEIRERLVNGMLWLQRPSGMFVTAFPPARQITGQEYFPGEALLALATQYSLDPSARILDAFDQAIGFYRRYFREARSPAFVPWQAQAFAIMARHTKRTDFADYVFELTDWLAAWQLTPSNCPWPEMHGGIAAYSAGRAGVATAAYLEGFADALDLAGWVGDARRAETYETLVRNATRFVMQLQVRPEEAYYIRSPRDAVGGIRTTPSLNLLRIDHCQHALVGLIKAREILFPTEGGHARAR